MLISYLTMCHFGEPSEPASSKRRLSDGRYYTKQQKKGYMKLWQAMITQRWETDIKPFVEGAPKLRQGPLIASSCITGDAHVVAILTEFPRAQTLTCEMQHWNQYSRRMGPSYLGPELEYQSTRNQDWL